MLVGIVDDGGLEICLCQRVGLLIPETLKRTAHKCVLLGSTSRIGDL